MVKPRMNALLTHVMKLNARGEVAYKCPVITRDEATLERV